MDDSTGTVFPDRRAVRPPSGRRILLCAFGTRGDIQPMVLLAEALRGEGHAVRLLINADHRRRAAAFEVETVTVGRFGEVLRLSEVGAAWRARAPLKLAGALRRLYDTLSASLCEVLQAMAREIEEADLVVYNPLSYFAGVLAQSRGIPSVQVTYTPNFPSRHAASFLVGGGDLGGVLNRLSYQSARVLPLMARGGVRRFEALSGGARRLPLSAHPDTLSRAVSTQLLAFSPALSPDDGAWPRGAVATGFWRAPPRGGEGLPDHLKAFLAEGEPPLFIGFGSVIADSQRITRVVLAALRIWGGRAILGNVGAGALDAPAWPCPHIATVGAVDYDLLFPHVAGVVHHGGAGTTAAVLSHARPSVVVASTGEQRYWGNHLAAAGAAEAPLWLWRLRPEELAARIAALHADPALRAGAARLSADLRGEPGLAGAVAVIERLAGIGADNDVGTPDGRIVALGWAA